MSVDFKKIQLSIVVPVYNEAVNLNSLFKRLETVMDDLGRSYEIVCINDGSKDDTLSRLIECHQRNPNIKVINLSRNFGKEIALTAGIDYATGAAVIPIDADLQDPPELIGELVEKWQEGYDVVYCTRRSRKGETWLKRFTANAFYRAISKMSRVPIPQDTGDFRLLDRRVVEALKLLPERTRFMKGLFSWVGFKQTAILFDREPRLQGTTTWNYWKLWNLALDGIISFSSLPLKIWSYLGLSISFLSLLYASFLVLRTIIFGIDVPGYASIIVAVLFLGGIQLITLGVLGEYLGRVYEEVKGRPIYLVRDVYGFESSATKLDTNNACE
ncbi:glycosyltransferase family 2 protein [Lusitaniella coriacea LEGE 07157]|uniref:Glycosyltransferase family 2 protein n=1 Tax=Lusitaniella coriacea LEGE 07157 TaxID=945747 RepID=A0A8J7JE00_9CYAN|nr:glycosyltransferase family 2 protein [Lusitaniella coriacea]MBE9118110.1 glycosyltransferase family 2 protein [Lusitaniella coriacea LEGE 07157]